MKILDKLFGRGPGDAQPVLDAGQRARWERDGYLMLPGFMAPGEIATVRRVVDEAWRRAPGDDHEIDVLTGPHAGRIFKVADVPPEVRGHAYKLNNLFARHPEIRRVALSPRLRQACAELLGGEPLIINSLNFERGSQQALHIDSWYMAPPVADRMVAASIAIDDVDADNGPIVYYPGSHLIPPHPHARGRENESPEGREYLAREIADRGLREEEMRARSGDVFIWHSQLLHGGRPIRDPARTRASLVVHYWRVQDLPADQVRTDPACGRYLAHTLRGEIRY